MVELISDISSQKIDRPNGLEVLRPTFAGIAEHARKLTERVSELETPEGRLTMRCALAASTLLRPLFAQDGGIDSELLVPVGGPDGNPHTVIDVMGGELIRSVVEADVEDTGQRVRLRIEENRQWEDVSAKNIPKPRGEHLLLVDPIDETKGIGEGLQVQSVGVLATKPDGSFAAAAVASLVPGDRRIALIEGASIHRLFYNERSGTITSSLPPPAPSWQIGDRLRIATLPRRLQALQKTPLFQEYGDRIDIQPTFGGFALLDMLMPQTAPTHAMIDTQKGQPWYEPWGSIAQQAGLVVRGRNGNPLPFDRLIRFAYEHEGNARVPQVICESLKVYDFIGPRLAPIRRTSLLNPAP